MTKCNDCEHKGNHILTANKSNPGDITAADIISKSLNITTENKKIKKLNKTQLKFNLTDIKKNRGLACLCYIPFFFILPPIIAPKSKYAEFHAVNGMRFTFLGITISIVLILKKLFLVYFYRADINNTVSVYIDAVLILIYITFIFVGLFCVLNNVNIKMPVLSVKKILFEEEKTIAFKRTRYKPVRNISFYK